MINPYMQPRYRPKAKKAFKTFEGMRAELDRRVANDNRCIMLMQKIQIEDGKIKRMRETVQRQVKREQEKIRELRNEIKRLEHEIYVVYRRICYHRSCILAARGQAPGTSTEAGTTLKARLNRVKKTIASQLADEYAALEQRYTQRRLANALVTGVVQTTKEMIDETRKGQVQRYLEGQVLDGARPPVGDDPNQGQSGGPEGGPGDPAN